MGKFRRFQGTLFFKLTALLSVLILFAGCRQDFGPDVPEKTQPQTTASIRPTNSTLPDDLKDTQSLALLDEKSNLRELPDLPHYQISVDVDPEGSTFSGEMILTYINLEDSGLSELNFRLFPNGGKSYGKGALYVSEVSGPENISLDYQLSLDETVMTVQLPGTIDPGESLVFRIAFNGKIPGEVDDPGYGLYSRRENVVALSGWYPILAVFDDEGWNLDPVSGIGDSVYSDAAYYDVSVITPGNYQIAATGSQQSLIEHQAGQNQRNFVSGPARDFFMILSPDFLTLTREVEGTAVNVYYRAGQSYGAKKAAEVASDSISVFNTRFGKYPYTELDVVAAPLNYAAGIEFPGVILIESDYFSSADELFFQIVTAHEVAHQWFYNLVGSDVIDEPWLDEALVTYASNLYFEDVYGEDLYNQLIAYYQEVVAEAEANGFGDQITQSLAYFEATERGRAAYSPMVYSKGSLFFHTLRERMGEEAFFLAIQYYFDMNQYEIGTPEELLGSFLEFSDQDLDPVFQEWLDITIQ